MYIIVLCIAYTRSDFIYCFNEQNTYTEYFCNWRILTSLCIWTQSVSPHRWPSVTGGARRLPSRCPRRPSASRTHSACRHWGTRWYTCTHILLSIHIIWNENPSVSSVSLTREEQTPNFTHFRHYEEWSAVFHDVFVKNLWYLLQFELRKRSVFCHRLLSKNPHPCYSGRSRSINGKQNALLVGTFCCGIFLRNHSILVHLKKEIPEKT